MFTPTDGFTPIARADVIFGGGPPSHHIYTCKEDEKDNSIGWALSDVEAFLYDQHGEQVGLHYFNARGGKPRWPVGESLITGALFSKVGSPGEDGGDNNIAWLWVNVMENNDFGVLGGKYDAVRIGRTVLGVV